MRSLSPARASAGALLTVCLGVAAWAGEDPEDFTTQELTINDVPPSVRATVLKEAEGAKIAGIRRLQKGRQTKYLANLVAGEKTTGLEVREDGTVSFRSSSEPVQLEQLPAAVKEAIRKEAGTLAHEGAPGKVIEVERVIEQGKLRYVASIQAGRRDLQVVVDLDGKVAERLTEEEVTFDQLPRAVQATIRRKCEGDTAGDFRRVTRKGRTFYDVDMTWKPIYLLIDPTGKLLKLDMEGELK